MSKKRIQSMNSYHGSFCRYKEQAQRRKKTIEKYYLYTIEEIVVEIKEEERLEKEREKKANEEYFKRNGRYPITLFTGREGMNFINNWIKEEMVNMKFEYKRRELDSTSELTRVDFEGILTKMLKGY